MKIIEKILMLLALIGIVMGIYLLPGNALITTVSLLLLAGLYFLLGFAFFNGIGFRNLFKASGFKELKANNIVAGICAGFGFSNAVVAILFKFQRLPGASVMLILALSWIVILLIVNLLFKPNNSPSFNKRVGNRLAIFGTIVLVLVFLPYDIWIDFLYQNAPAYKEILKKLAADPTNPELQQLEQTLRSQLY